MRTTQGLLAGRDPNKHARLPLLLQALVDLQQGSDAATTAAEQSQQSAAVLGQLKDVPVLPPLAHLLVEPLLDSGRSMLVSRCQQTLLWSPCSTPAQSLLVEPILQSSWCNLHTKGLAQGSNHGSSLLTALVLHLLVESLDACGPVHNRHRVSLF